MDERDRGSVRPCAEILVGWALEAGFDLAAVAGVEPAERGGVYLDWLARGDHAGMAWMAERVEERLEPARVLDGARSVLCVGLRYAPVEDPAAERGDFWPRVARYARGRDYHNLMGKRLAKLARRLRRELPGTDTRTYVDTGPVLERELAERAGLGTVGKNTCLLTRAGSWFLLGELFTSLEPGEGSRRGGTGGAGEAREGAGPGEVEEGRGEPVGPRAGAEPPWEAPSAGDEAAVFEMCGSCTLCLDACPTGAFPEPGRLDSNRCISYWTIEHRGAVPEPVRREIGEWVFGCDVCQEVCPWNRGERGRASEPDLLIAPRRAELDLAGLLALGEEEYRERFRGSAMQRARLEGLKRNAATVMGNTGEERWVEPLARALSEDPDPLVRGAAAWALGEIGGERARSALGAARAGEDDPEVLHEAEAAAERLAGERERPHPAPGG